MNVKKRGFFAYFRGKPVGGRQPNRVAMPAKTDVFQSPDYFQVDELLTEEHKLIRDSVRNYVKKQISPIIEEFAQNSPILQADR